MRIDEQKQETLLLTLILFLLAALIWTAGVYHQRGIDRSTPTRAETSQ